MARAQCGRRVGRRSPGRRFWPRAVRRYGRHAPLPSAGRRATTARPCGHSRHRDQDAGRTYRYTPATTGIGRRLLVAGLRRGGRLPPGRRCFCLRCIAAGLADGLARDVRPPNRYCRRRNERAAAWWGCGSLPARHGDRCRAVFVVVFVIPSFGDPGGPPVAVPTARSVPVGTGRKCRALRYRPACVEGRGRGSDAGRVPTSTARSRGVWLRRAGDRRGRRWTLLRRAGRTSSVPCPSLPGRHVARGRTGGPSVRLEHVHDGPVRRDSDHLELERLPAVRLPRFHHASVDAGHLQCLPQGH